MTKESRSPRSSLRRDFGSGHHDGFFTTVLLSSGGQWQSQVSIAAIDEGEAIFAGRM